MNDLSRGSHGKGRVNWALVKSIFFGVAGVCAASGLLFVAVTWIQSRIDSAVERKLSDPKILRQIAAESRPTVIFDANESIIADLGGAQFIKNITIKRQEKDEKLPTSVDIDFTIHLPNDARTPDWTWHQQSAVFFTYYFAVGAANTQQWFTYGGETAATTTIASAGSAPSGYNETVHLLLTPAQDLVVSDAFYRAADGPVTDKGFLDNAHALQDIIDDALGTYKYNPVSFYTGNIYDVQGNWVGWEDPNTGNIYDAEGDWYSWDPGWTYNFDPVRIYGAGGVGWGGWGSGFNGYGGLGGYAGPDTGNRGGGCPQTDPNCGGSKKPK